MEMTDIERFEMYRNYKLGMEICMKMIDYDQHYAFNGTIRDIKYDFVKIDKIDHEEVRITLFSKKTFSNGIAGEKIRYDIDSKHIQHLINPHDYGGEHYNLYKSIWFEDSKVLNLELVQKLLADLYEKIKVLKLDKLFGKLVVDTCKEDFEYMEALGECFVCKGETSIRTDCKHYLCIRCWSQKCPTCKRRRYITVYDGESNYNRDDEDSDEEMIHEEEEHEQC